MLKNSKYSCIFLMTDYFLALHYCKTLISGQIKELWLRCQTRGLDWLIAVKIAIHTRVSFYRKG
jgi:hypothetical protein